MTDAPVLVVGDSMLDRYWEGRVERISPEAPVPVLQVMREFARAGGAANVALNLAALGARVSLLTLIGDDEAGITLSRLLQGASVTVHAVGGSRHRTTQKIRCVAQRHQLLRTDFENAAADECVDLLGAMFGRVVPERGVVVFSDYAKGALRDCAELAARARGRGCRVLVDPKGADFSRYRGADLLKPNANELKSATGGWDDEQGLRAKCMSLRRRLRLGALLLTRGDEGMTLFQAAGALHYPAELREVFDVSGAGDTVIAAVARCVALGYPVEDAARWANRAAALAVSKFGTAVVTLAELEAAHGPMAAPIGAPAIEMQPAVAPRAPRAARSARRGDGEVMQ